MVGLGQVSTGIVEEERLVIDFGRAIDLKVARRTIILETQGRKALAARKCERTKLGVSIDCFAIAATIHVMLHGEYMKQSRIERLENARQSSR